MTDDEMIKSFEHTIYTQLRTLGVVLHDDVGERIKPGSGEEHRVVNNIARNIAKLVVSERDCQTPVAGSSA